MGCSLSFLRHTHSPFKRYFSRRRPIFFKGPAHRQDFDLPDPIMDYIAKNASSAAVYRKLVQSCKYFFIKRPLIVISCMHQTKDGFYTCLIDKKKGFEKFDMEKISTKMLWLSNKFVDKCDQIEESDEPFTPVPPNMLIPKFYRTESLGINWNNSTCTLEAHCSNDSLSTKIYFRGVQLDPMILGESLEQCVEEILFFASRSAIHLHLYNCIVQYENGEPVQLETLLAQFPSLQYLLYSCHPDGLNVSVNTVKKILANPYFSKMRFFHLFNIPDTFDVESFYAYLKSRDDFFCLLEFRSDISDAYHERLQAIIDELLSTESTSFWFPFINFPNLHQDTYNALKKRFNEDCKRRKYKYTSFSL